MKKKIVIMGMLRLWDFPAARARLGERSGGAEADAEREVCGAGGITDTEINDRELHQAESEDCGWS